MKTAFVTVLATWLAASAGVSAAPALPSPDTSPNPLNKRGLWFRDECHATIGGTVVGGSTLWMLRNTWNNNYGGDFGGNLGVYEIKGVCCWGQCLWVASEGQGRSWSGDAWGNAHHRLTGITGGSQRGLCGARLNNDAYLVMMSAQHNQVSHQGRKIGEIFGDTCRGNPPW
ncbi:hypothetical protein C7974DRAFT_155797 [Boeremia exigua]|uniref:uncharacterized protein n=1 Tax=Boeremia exigua TaxID=749465 RepID=UPI001E8E675A|nr:uncharacterized protein C7974DRAFT_155797 [Boeremia exigua]KAH6638179.1 hypothetical protein C7974DRAFT_155797 [Boeremia exigua]